MLVATVQNDSINTLNQISKALLTVCRDICQSCLIDYEVSQIAYTSNINAKDGKFEYLSYLDDSITKSTAFVSDQDKTANVRIQLNIPRRFQNFVRLVFSLWNVKFDKSLLVETVLSFQSVNGEWLFKNTYLGYIADIFFASNIDINNYNQTFQSIQHFYFNSGIEVSFDAVRQYVDKMRSNLKKMNESMMDALDSYNKKVSDILSGQADGAYWDERPDTHSNMIAISVICVSEDILWDISHMLLEKIETIASAYLNNVDISVCATSDKTRDYYMEKIPDFAVRTRSDDPFYSLVRRERKLKQAQVRIQFNPPKNFRKMTRFINYLYENSANLAHVITICSIWISNRKDYCATHCRTEIVNRIFNIVSHLDDEGLQTYAKHLKDALLPYYHKPENVDESTIDNDAAVQFIKSINEHVLKLREQKGEQIF